MRLVPEMVGELDLERSLDQWLGQLGQQTAGPDDLLLGLRAGQQLINDLVGKLAAQVVSHVLKHPRRGRRRLAWRLAADALTARDPRSRRGKLLFG
jgi:hypothetical protein